jgi:hypothetical protein
MARIVTVYSPERRALSLVDMSYVRWFKISEALARRGHRVDIATAEWRWLLGDTSTPLGPNLRKVPLSRVQWTDYDVVKTLFQQGFDTLQRHGGGDHPFIIAKVGSVVGPTDMEGIYFFGAKRRALFATQEAIAAKARYVTVLTQPARDLWQASFGDRPPVLIVPGAVDAELPPIGADPYPSGTAIRCLFAGNFYTTRSQPEANRALVDKLNALGSHLRSQGARLFIVGPGDARRLDRAAVTYVGAVPYAQSWDYMRHAHVGIVVSAGPFMHNNESSKIYHYLRAGLPTVSESGFPNDDVVRQSGLGEIVPSGDIALLASSAVRLATTPGDRAGAIDYIIQHHTWDARARVYDEILRQELPMSAAPRQMID